jgi:hypothetical protein
MRRSEKLLSMRSRMKHVSSMVKRSMSLLSMTAAQEQEKET